MPERWYKEIVKLTNTSSEVFKLTIPDNAKLITLFFDIFTAGFDANGDSIKISLARNNATASPIAYDNILADQIMIIIDANGGGVIRHTHFKYDLYYEPVGEDNSLHFYWYNLTSEDVNAKLKIKYWVPK